MRRKNLNKILMVSLLSCLSIYGGFKAYNANASPSSQVNVTVPSDMSVIFNEDGTNTISNYNITNNSLVPITVDNINLSSKNGWSIVPSGTKILRDTKSLSLSLFNKWLNDGDNNMSVVIDEGSNKNLSPLVERGAWTKEVKESAFDLNISYNIGKKDFTLSFNPNGGNDVESIVAKNGDSVTLPNAIKKGYTFTGWLDSNGIIHNAGSSYTMPIGGDELVAQWRVNKLYIQYNMNGGVLGETSNTDIGTSNGFITLRGSTIVQTFSYGESLGQNGLCDWNNLTHINISKLGYIAPSGAQWNTSLDGTGTSYDQYVAYKTSDLADLSNGDVTLTLYVNWKPIKYTIYFDGNYGNSGSTASMNVDYDSSVNLSPNGFYKNAHTFTNWNTSPYGTGTSYSNKQEIKNLSHKNGDTITLYAQWEPNDISFNFKPENGEKDYNLNGVLGDMYDLTTPIKNGYDFSGWEKSDYYGLFGKYNRNNTFDNGSLGDVRVYKYGYTDSDLFGNLEIINASDDNPTSSKYEAKITATAAYPIDGVNRYVGFCTTGYTTPEKSYVHTFKAKIPKGVKVGAAHNSLGIGGEIHWYTEQYGTGEWETYSYIAELGPNSEGYAIGYIYVDSVDNSIISAPFSWNLAYSKIMEVTNVSTDPVLLLGSDNNTLTAKWTPKKYKVHFDENYIENNLYDTFYDLNYWDFNSTIDSSNKSFAIKEDSSLDSGRYVEISLGTPVGGNYAGGYYYGGDRLVAGKTYTWSVNIKASRNGVLSQIGDEQNGLAYNVNVGTEWKTIRHTFTAQDTPHGSFTFYYSSTGSFQQGDKIYVSNLQLMEGSPSVLTEVKDYGSKLGVLPTVTREGYTFLGWYTGINSGDKTSSDAIVSVDNSTYYAKWRPNDNIKYKVNHYHMNLDGSTYSLVETENKTGISNKNLDLSSLKKDYTGFTYKDGKINNKVVSSVSINPDGSTVIDLYYSRNKCKLDLNGILDGTVYYSANWGTFDVYLNGTKVDSSKKDYNTTVYYGSTYEFKLVSTDAGRQFNGARLGSVVNPSDGTTHIGSDLKGTITGTTIVFSDFSTITYNIGYDLDGGTNPNGSKTSYTIGTNYTLPTPSKSGYSFLGWHEFYQMSDWNPGDLIGSSGDVTASDRGAYYSEFISVKAGYTYSWVNQINGRAVGARFYDSNYSYKYYATDDNDSYTPSENGYMRFLIVNYSEGDEDYLKIIEKSPSGYVTSIKPTDIGDRNFIADWSVNSYYLDVNGLLDGTFSNGTKNYGTFDVYINGTLTAQGVDDYYGLHTYGSTYEIKNIVPAVGHTYTGLIQGTLKGTIGIGHVDVVLSFNTNIFTVKYESNGADSGSMGTTSVTYGNPTKLEKNKFVKKGYTFGGWVAKRKSDSKIRYSSTNGSDTGWYLEGQQPSGWIHYIYKDETEVYASSTVDKDVVTMVAKWNINTGNMYYYPNGGVPKDEYPLITSGEFAGASSKVVGFDYNSTSGNTVMDVSTGFIRNGYYASSDKAWILGSPDSGIFIKDFDQDLSSFVEDNTNVNLKLYANWKPVNYSITYNLNGGTNPNSGVATNYTIESNNITLPTPTRTGHTFEGWFDNSSFTGTAITSIPSGSTGNKTYYAKWAVNTYYLDVSGVLDGVSEYNTVGYGTFDVYIDGVLKAQGASDYYTRHPYGTSYEIKNIVPTIGHHYVGVHSGSLKGTIGAVHTTVRLALNTNTYKVVYNANGGTGSTATSNHKYGEAKTLTPNGFSKTGYSFAGWATSASGNVVYSNSQSVSNLTATNGGTVTLYAVWKANSYTLTFNPNGGTVSETSRKVAQGSPLGKLPVPTRPGYIFNGWFEYSYGGTQYTESSIMGSSDLTIYASWTQKTTTLIDGPSFNSTLLSMLGNCTKISFTSTSIPSNKISTAKIVSNSNSTNKAYMYVDGSTLFISPDESGVSLIAPVDCTTMFLNAKTVTTLDLSNFNLTTSTAIMKRMFQGMSSLTSLDVSKFKTSNVTDMMQTFQDCRSLTSLDVSKFSTSKVTTMNYMFYGCSSLKTLTLTPGVRPTFVTTSVTDMSFMFAGCNSLPTVNLSSFNTSKVTNMSSMFNGCLSLTSLNLANFNTSNVTSMSGMFADCRSLASLNLSSFTDYNVTNFSYMFSECINLSNLNISNMGLHKATTVREMFYNCPKLSTTVTVRGNPSNYLYMFKYTATASGSMVSVNYTSSTSALVLSMIDTKSPNSNVTLGFTVYSLDSDSSNEESNESVDGVLKPSDTLPNEQPSEELDNVVSTPQVDSNGEDELVDEPSSNVESGTSSDVENEPSSDVDDVPSEDVEEIPPTDNAEEIPSSDTIKTPSDGVPIDTPNEDIPSGNDS